MIHIRFYYDFLERFRYHIHPLHRKTYKDVSIMRIEFKDEEIIIQHIKALLERFQVGNISDTMYIMLMFALEAAYMNKGNKNTYNCEFQKLVKLLQSTTYEIMHIDEYYNRKK